MAQTVVVKGRLFSVDDSLANDIERTCSISGSEIRLDAPRPKDTPRPRTDEDHPPRASKK